MLIFTPLVLLQARNIQGKKRGVKNVFVNTSRLRLWKTEKGEEGWLGKDQTGRKHAQRVCVPVLGGGGGG